MVKHRLRVYDCCSGLRNSVREFGFCTNDTSSASRRLASLPLFFHLSIALTLFLSLFLFLPVSYSSYTCDSVFRKNELIRAKETRDEKMTFCLRCKKFAKSFSLERRNLRREASRGCALSIVRFPHFPFLLFLVSRQGPAKKTGDLTYICYTTMATFDAIRTSTSPRDDA